MRLFRFYVPGDDGRPNAPVFSDHWTDGQVAAAISVLTCAAAAIHAMKGRKE